MTPENLAEKHGATLYDIIRQYEVEDEAARSYHLKIAKLGEYYFRGFQNVYWDAQAQDYRDFLESPDADDDDEYYSKVVNLYRAHGETIISALSVDTPVTSFSADNAENADDISTAQNYTNAGLLIQKHNRAHILFIRACYLLWTQGFLAGYNYNHASEDYGTYEKSKVEDVDKEVSELKCPQCGHIFEPDEVGNDLRVVNEFDEETQEATLNSAPATRCPNCESLVDPEEEVRTEKVPTIVGITKEPKTRECLEVYGLTHIKVAPYARCQKDTPYLIFESEEHLSKIRYDYRFEAAPYGDSDSAEEKTARQPQMLEELEGHTATVKRVWLRPSALFANGMEEGNELLEDFPKGVFATFVNGICLKAIGQALDDHWTIYEQPTSSHIHPDPMGKPLIDINDIENEITNLTLQTMEQGIGQTFVNSEALDFEKYRNTEARPGQLYPVTLPAGRDQVSSQFYSTKTAIMSQEIDKFSSRNQENGRFVVGSYPSLYGGTMSGGSKTYSEYAASRQQAMQRLMTPYTALASWWASVMGKAVPEYVESLEEDETFTVKDGKVTINKVIRANTDNGRIGSVEPDASRAFPLTWQQKRDVMLELIKLQVPEINEAILVPENATFLAELIGLPELNLPGQKSRLKQYIEIQQLLMDQPLGEAQSSVPVDPDVDDHIAEARVCRDFLQSQAGLDLKEYNPAGRANILAHLKEHLAMSQMQMASMQGGTPPGQVPDSSSPNATP